MDILNIGRHVYVNRGADIVQRGKISAHVVTTREVRPGEVEVTAQYEVKFPRSMTFHDEDTQPFSTCVYFDSKNVYLSLEEAFAMTHNAVAQ